MGTHLQRGICRTGLTTLALAASAVLALVSATAHAGQPGACCLLFGGCAMTPSQSECDAVGGEYQGDGSDCDEPGTCGGASTGACCTLTGCVVVPEGLCNFLGGDWGGEGTNCVDNPCDLDPIGACCFPESCVIVTEDECDAANGLYRGDDTICTPEICPAPTGACCLPNGTCQELSETGCTSDGGTYQGNGISCDTPGICDTDPTGACCVGTTCVQTTSVNCGSVLGDYKGDGSSCTEPGICDTTPTGACCLEIPGLGITCSSLTADECAAIGGDYKGDGSSCDTPGICLPRGACCFPSSCLDATESDCAILLGDYQGNGTACVTTMCPPPGACCMPDGSCIDTNEGFCNAVGGDFKGAGTICSTTDCPQPGACCIDAKGVLLCFDKTEAECAASGGTFKGEGSSCQTPNICTPLGACCLSNGNCREGTFDECETAGGEYQGDNTTCLEVVCQQPDRVDATEKGSLLIFPRVEVRWSMAPLAGGSVIQDTFIDIANDFPQDVRVQMFFVNGDPRITTGGGIVLEPGWNNVDNLIELTANEPTYWSAATGLPKGVSPWSVLDPGALPGRIDPENPTQRVLRGFIIAFAVNELGQEIRWNHLKGDACIVNYPLAAAWEYNAYSFRAVNAAIPNGQQTGTPGEINMNGFEFARGFDQLLLDFYAIGSAAFSGPGTLVTLNTELTLHPIEADLRQETDGPVTTKASFDIWNMNEVKFSGTDRCITCWDQALLSSYGLPNHFFLVNLQTDKGRARINGLESILCPAPGLNGIAGGGGAPSNGSRFASLLGVAAKIAVFDGGAGVAHAGTNLHGFGYQNARIRFDFNAYPPSEAAAREAVKPAKPKRRPNRRNR